MAIIRINLQEIADSDRYSEGGKYTRYEANNAVNERPSAYSIEGDELIVDTDKVPCSEEEIRHGLQWGCQWNNK